jgi:hypothetical protein
MRRHLLVQDRLDRPLDDSPQEVWIVEQHRLYQSHSLTTIALGHRFSSLIVVRTTPLSWRTVATPVTRTSRPLLQHYRDTTFVDNSTQSYFNNVSVLEPLAEPRMPPLRVAIAYDRDTGFLRISDNAMGMSYAELEQALHVAQPPANTTGRSQYGMGMKTAAGWLGNQWLIRTKKLGESDEHQVRVDVQKIASGQNEIDYKAVPDRPKDEHYTIIEITEHHRKFQGRTMGKIKEFLQSMYREDFRNGVLHLEWQGVPLVWEEKELLVARDGTKYRQDFDFDVHGKQACGWVGILASGSRADAGFSIIHRGRVIRGFPDAWRPSSLYGQFQGSNDLVNQRLIGEIHLDAFDVSHTKDDILWVGDEEDVVEEELRKRCNSYREIAKTYRPTKGDDRGPSPADTDVAVNELKKELTSPEMVDAIVLDTIPPEEIVERSIVSLVESVTSSERLETFRVNLPSLTIKVYLADDMSHNDPYVAVESPDSSTVIVVVNQAHPYWNELEGGSGVLNYLRECMYDAIAEWQAMRITGRLHAHTIKMLKDRLLRIPFGIEMRQGEEEQTASAVD